MNTLLAGDGDTVSEIPRYFISLGAGSHQLPLIQAARDLGYRVIAVDRDSRAPGFSRADIQLQSSILRPGHIVREIRENLIDAEVVGIGCRSYGRAGLSAALIAGRFGTPGNTWRSLLRFADKRRLKNRLADHGIPIPRNYGWSTEKQRETLLNANVSLLVRPARGHGKLGLRLLEDRTAVARFLKDHPQDDGTLLVEERITSAKEITVMGVVEHGHYESLLITDKFTSQNAPLFIETRHDFPAEIDGAVRRYVDQYLQKVVEVCGIRTGPVVAEFLVPLPETRRSGDPRMYLVECAPETGGEYLMDHLAPAAYERLRETSYFHDLVGLLTGSTFPIFEYRTERRYRVTIRFIPQREGTLRSVRFPDRLERHPGLLFARRLKQPGDRTAFSGGNADRLAVFALRGPIEHSAQLDADADAFVADTQVEYEETGDEKG